MLASLNAEGAAFAIGRTMGAVVGQLLVEALLAALPRSPDNLLQVLRGFVVRY